MTFSRAESQLMIDRLQNTMYSIYNPCLDRLWQAEKRLSDECCVRRHTFNTTNAQDHIWS
jgi:hypothetical protein